MILKDSYKKLNSYIENNMLQLTGSFLLSDYYELLHSFGSKKMTNKMKVQLEQTRQKSISADIILKLNEVIKVYNNNQIAKIDPTFKKSIKALISKVEKHIKDNPGHAFQLYIDHDFTPTSVYILLMDLKSSLPEYHIDTGIDYTSIWGILESEEWKEVEEFFEGIFIKEEEFMQEFRQAFLFQSYVKFYEVLEELNFIKEAKDKFPDGLKVTIAEHDSHEFEILKVNLK